MFWLTMRQFLAQFQLSLGVFADWLEATKELLSLDVMTMSSAKVAVVVLISRKIGHVNKFYKTGTWVTSAKGSVKSKLMMMINVHYVL